MCVMGSDKKLANVVGAKTARACDSCIKKRARFYCAADDAFLCQVCDGLVHSANSLARRHERIRLKTVSYTTKSSKYFPPPMKKNDSLLPTWHQGFKRKARTPRHHHGKSVTQLHREAKWEESVRDPLQNLVPEIGSEEMTWQEENEEQLLYRVPVFDPFVAEFCLSVTSNDQTAVVGGEKDRPKVVLSDCAGRHDDGINGNSLCDDLLPCDMDLAEFAADVESLLGKALDEESKFDMEGLGILDCREKGEECSSGDWRVKVEEDDDVEAHAAVTEIDDMAREPFELNFDYDSPSICCDQEDRGRAENKVVQANDYVVVGEENKKKNKVVLRLDWEGVVAAWADQRCPWTTGDRPELDADDCWPDNMGGCGTVDYSSAYGDRTGVITSGQMMTFDEGREARVLRYREKRRTRLFSKKIRYEVRKLNAEKRPRMKGRFVKRSNFSAPHPPPPFPLLNTK
ncbi:hypothetical protein LguiA_000572 [Lonicera macranthoides]